MFDNCEILGLNSITFAILLSEVELDILFSVDPVLFEIRMLKRRYGRTAFDCSN
jgi:hypothetical protein